MDERALVFEVEAPFAHFRRVDGNTVRQTYSCPTRTAIEGFLGAIMGYGRNEYYEDLGPENLDIAIDVKNNIKKMQVPQTFLKTEEDAMITKNDIKMVDPSKTEEGRQRFNMQYLRDVKYKIYLIMYKTDIIDNLKSRIDNNRYFYSPYLGTTECIISNINYLSEESVEHVKLDEQNVSTVVPEEDSILHLDEKTWYKVERIPYRFEKEETGRRPKGYKNYYISNDSLRVSSKEGKIISGNKIIPM